MKPTRLLLLTAILVGAWLSGARAQSLRTLSVGSYENPPLVFHGPAGEIQGLTIDVLTAAAEEHGLRLVFEFGDWQPLLGRIENGSLDLLVAVAYSEERAARFAFGAQTVFTNWGSLCTRPGLHVSSLLDLEGLRVAFVPRDIYGEDLARTLGKFGVEHMAVPCADYAAVHAALREGRADAGVTSRLYNALYLAKNRLQSTPIVFNPIEIRYAAGTEAGRGALELIDATLTRLKADGGSAYYGSLDNWLGAAPSVRLPAWLPNAMLSLTAGILALVVVSLVLRRRVAARTAELDARNSALSAEIAERARVEERLRDSLREKESLLAEIHHRVKNNLQVVHSLLSLQSQYIADPDARGLIQECRNRVRSMSLVHEKLYSSPDLAGIDFAEYLNEVTRQLMATYRRGDGVRLEVQAESDFLDVERAVPLGLVVNELVTNALKHAFPPGQGGTIVVRWTTGTGGRRLEVSDDGGGLPPGFAPEHCDGLGMRLVCVLTRQLGGSLEVGDGSGASFRLSLSPPA